ncbi:MAG: hypothetical protein JNL43_14100 [Flavobacteriales bacterium]|nr:hypothetical protein [Flavobacteriales bacterium]
MAIARFIGSISVFVLGFILLLLSIILGVGRLLDRASFKLPEGTSTLILGDSQMEFALNDSILPGSVSMAQSGEAYLYAFNKARRFIADNPGLDTIWLSYNMNSLERRQEILTRSERYSKNKIPYNFFLLTAADLDVFWRQGSAYEVLARTPWLRRNYIKKALRRATTYRDLSFGGYAHSERNKLAFDVARRDSLIRAKATPPPGFGEAKDQVRYLIELVSLCKREGITCILVNTPVHPVIKAEADTAAYYAFRREHMADVPLWDHSDWTFPDSCFGDATHLNHKGAKLYSEYLKALRVNRWEGVDQRHLAVRSGPVP